MSFLKSLKNKLVSNVSYSASKVIRKVRSPFVALDPAQHGFPHHAIDIPSDGVCSEFCAVIPEDISRSTIIDFYHGDIDAFDLSAQRYSKRYYPHQRTLEDYYL
ncbi:hypothetical protein MUCCIDRAFT_108935 [Mucor lusitanicus CBS 277.49]|uniref:Uncharacterized protein n=1 Tax=Mucor lusitanicus CBS 277.49 TaxID=747725 RepID=A0A168ML89_MUCCL|nr:hypothetical protein MUCCIDRAFT_108935 [Mucor lusitanicus CBS 277.49]